MLASFLGAMILGQNRLQLHRLPGRNRGACAQLPLVADHVFRIALIAYDGGDLVEFAGALLTLLPRSNCNRLHRKVSLLPGKLASA